MAGKSTPTAAVTSPGSTGKGGFVPSPEQQNVIDHRGGHLQVVACAGAGKTEAISRRVSSLIEEGVEPGQIVAFTFTERAAESLKTRITKRIAEAKGQDFLDRLGPMFVGTIHSYCLRLLQDHVPQFGNYDILDENRLAGLLSREHKRLELSKIGNQHWRPIFDFLRNADVVENEQIDPPTLAGTAFGDCYLRFREALERYHFLTFGQLITATIAALKEPAIFERVHGQLKHLIVDEYQDINPAQEMLIGLLARPPVHLCVVADDDQAIYQWRGSDVSNMLEFTKRYPSVKSLPLSVNRRCRPHIIATANQFATTISPRLSKKMEPHRPAGGPEIHSWSAETAVAEAETIADTIEKLREKGYRYKDIAILYRSVRTSSPPLIEVLRDRGIPFRCAGRTGLFLQPEAAILGMFYAWLCDNEWKSERYGQSEPVHLDDVIDGLQNIFADGEEIDGLRQYLEDWKNLVKDTTAPVSLVRDFYRLLNLLGVQELDLDDPNSSARMGCLARFSQIFADFEHVTRRARYVEENGERVFRGGQDRGIYFYQRLFNYLQYYALDAYEDFEGEDTFDLDTVDILTIHQAKGLEWPVVFVPSLVKGRFPSKYAGESQDWLIPETVFPKAARRRYEGGETEERRLFYVALTRAKDMLYLSRFQRLKNRFQPSPFLLEVAGGDPPLMTDIPLSGPFSPAADEAEEQPTVSFSELALYEGCPLRYRFNTSFGFQPQLATELGYGRAIHHILRRVADLTKANKRLPTAAEVEAVIDESFYLPFANNAAFHQLFNRAQALVSKYLADYSDDLLRVWETERAFELHLEDGIVNGRADVILDREGGMSDNLAIVDYKTANDQKSDDVFAFQLAIYASAGRGEGLSVESAYLHQLKESSRTGIPIDAFTVEAARSRANGLIKEIVAGNFPAKPDKSHCRMCDVRAICKHAMCGKYDL
jgi:DNA helicase-2/ATP-dependent DNA helicase PcrA